jgi:diguanylate cyclase (GGDEF)-like protein
MSEARRYTLLGILFGFMFPVGSLMVVHFSAGHSHDFSPGGFLDALAAAHAHNPLLYVIDTAPVFLGWLSWLAGVRQDRVRRLLSGLEREVLDKTRSLRQALVDAEQANHMIARIAAQDALTGLMNRRRIQEEIDRWAAHAKRYDRRMALLYIDFDHFKQVNDHHGHAAGDQFLAKAGQVLRNSCRGTDFLARWGGDEFVALLPEAGDSDAATAARKLIAAFKAERLKVGTAVLQMSASVGIALLPGDSSNVEELLRFADQAMYEAKQAGGGRWCRHGQAPSPGVTDADVPVPPPPQPDGTAGSGSP